MEIYGEDWRPSHFDEWRNIAIAQQAIASGKIERLDPVGSPNGLAKDISDRNRSLGFVAIVAAWITLAPDPIGNFKALALVFLLIYIFAAYALCRTIGIGHWAALPPVLAIGVLPTDTMLLGPALAVPSSLSMGMLCFALIAHLRLSAPSPRNSYSWWALLLFAGAILATVYPLSLIVFGVLVGIDILARPQLIRTPYAICLGTLGFVGALIFLSSEWQGEPAATIRHLNDLFFIDQRWHLVELIIYTIDYSVPPALLALAIAGAGLSLRRRDRAWLFVSLAGPLLTIAGYQLFGSGLILPYQRTGLYLAFGSIICAAVALEQILAKMEERRIGSPGKIGLVLVCLCVIAFSPRPPPPFSRMAQLSRPNPSLEAMAREIASTYQPPARFYSLPMDALFIEALTGLSTSPEVLDSLLTGNPPPVLHCSADWSLVVGECPCDGYELIYRRGPSRIYARRHARSPAQ